MKKFSISLTLILFLLGIFFGTPGFSQKEKTHPSVASSFEAQAQEMMAQKAGQSGGYLQGLTFLSTLQAGGNRLVVKQNPDGGWGWPLDGPSALNTLGPIAMGLGQAYLSTSDPSHLAALGDAGGLLLTKTNNFSPSDGYLAAMLDQIFGGSTYRNHVNTNFYGPLAAGTYNRNGAGTYYNTASYILLIRTNRSGEQANMAAWDIGMGLVGAASCGVTGTELTYWIDGTKAEINELNSAGWYDVIGLAGGLYGLAFVDEEFSPTAGSHAGAANLQALAVILASYQINNGGFAWNSAWVIPNDFDESIQETAYAILALSEVNRAGFNTNILGAANYIASVQNSFGGWANDQYYNEENNEVTGEALWGYTVAHTETTIETPTKVSCGVYDVDVTVQNFTDIGAISLVLNFDPLFFAYRPTAVTLNPAISSALKWTNIFGQFRLAWDGNGTGITLDPGTILFTLHFTLLPASSGTTNLTWSTIPGECEYAGPGGVPVYVDSFFDVFFTVPIDVFPVRNTNTGLGYCTIQAAIDDPATNNLPEDQDVITVAAGNYPENIVINKDIFLKGANSSKPCNCLFTRGTESIISGSATVAVTIASDGVTIDGFMITNPGGNFAIYAEGRNDITVMNNKITQVGNTVLSGASYGVAVVMSSTANIQDALITDNCISDINGGADPTLTGTPAKLNNGSAGGIGVGWSNANFSITYLMISNNLISDIDACINDWANGGKGAYGVIINVGAGGAAAGTAINPVVQYNTISDLEGLWAHGVGLEGETPGASVHNNDIFGLTDYKLPSDAVGVQVEDNAGALTVGIHDNSFTAMSLGIQNVTPLLVNATCNWYGSAASAVVASKISGSVGYVNWLVNGVDQQNPVCQPGFLPLAGSCTGSNLEVTLISKTDESCPCSFTGAIDIGVTGGSGTYTYLWSPGGETTQDLTGLTGGTYTVVVTDTWTNTATLIVNVGTTPDATPPAISCPTTVTVNDMCSGPVTWMPDVTFFQNYGTNAFSACQHLWQSFTATTTGILTQVDLYPYSASNTGPWNVTIYDGEGEAGCVLYNNPSFTPTGSPIIFPIPRYVGVYVVYGQKYTISIVGPCNAATCDVCVDLWVRYDNGAVVYTDGKYFDNMSMGNPPASCNPPSTVTFPDGLPTDKAALGATYHIDQMASPFVATDNCKVKYVTCSPENGSTFTCGTTPVIATATDFAGLTASCTFNVIVNAPAVVLNCPATVTEAACQTQAAIDTKFATWLGTVVASGGCGGVLTTNPVTPSAPLACGGSTTVTWTYTSSCVPNTTTCSATFYVDAPLVVELTCPQPANEAACQTQAAIDGKFAAWLATAGFTGGCNGVLTNNNTGAPLACGGSKTVIFKVTSSCETDVTCSATFSVAAPAPVTLTCPENYNSPACMLPADVDLAFNNWLNSFSFTGGCNPVVTRVPAIPARPHICGGQVTVTWTVTSDCQAPVTCEATFKVLSQPPVLTCPNIKVVDACTSPVDIQSFFDVWLGSVSLVSCPWWVVTTVPETPVPPPACGGIVTVTWWANCNCGETGCTCPPLECTSTFEVLAPPLPTIICPPAVTAYMNTVCTATGVVLGSPVTTGCNILSVVPTVGGLPINPLTYAFVEGPTTVTWVVTDGCSQTASCPQVVTVLRNDLSGTLKYPNNLTPLNGVTLTLNTGATYVTGTNPLIPGGYSFPGLCAGTYTITATDNKLVGGINATDAAQVNAWGVGPQTSIEKVRFFAGDAIFNNLIEAVDASRILGYFVTAGIPPMSPKWKFWWAGEMTTANPYLGSNTISIAIGGGPISNKVLYGLCTGDYNMSFAPTAGKSASETLTLDYAQTMQVQTNTEFELPINAGMDMEAGAVSLIMNFPSDNVEITGVFLSSDPDSPLMYNISGDELRIGWTSLSPVWLNEGESLITLKMKVNDQTGNGSIYFSLAGDPLNELADGNYEVIGNAVLTIDVVKASALGFGENSLAENLTLSNHPNPFNGTTTFVYSIPVDGKVILEIYDLLGNKVKVAVDETQSAGTYSLKLDANQLQPGVYTATIKLKNTATAITRTIKIISK
jgi:hypothetical protein